MGLPVIDTTFARGRQASWTWRGAPSLSSSPERRGALLAGGPDAFVEGLGREGHGLGEGLPLQGGVVGRVAAIGEGELGEAARDRRRGGDVRRHREHVVEERRVV